MNKSRHLPGSTAGTEVNTPRRPRMRACDAALEILKEHQSPGVMYGDEWLCHQIAERLGWEHEGPYTTRRVLAALSRTPGRLVKSRVVMPGDCCARGQSVLHFELPPDLMQAWVPWMTHVQAPAVAQSSSD
jgi:hypothetical protein